MTHYEITLGNQTPAVVGIEADEVSYDPHWVSFRVKEEPERPPTFIHCEACGASSGVQRARPVSRTVTVAIFPASQVRRVIRVEP